MASPWTCGLITAPGSVIQADIGAWSESRQLGLTFEKETTFL